METERFEVLVVGTGAVGLSAAVAFARAGFATGLVGPEPARSDGRTAALLDGPLRILSGLGIGPAIEATSAPLRRLRIVDDTGSLFRPPPVEFRSDEIGLSAFGRNIENAALLSVLADAARRETGLTWRVELAGGLDGAERVLRADGSPVEADLTVAADGRRSPIREALGIRVTARAYPQTALTTILRHEAEHEDCSTEFHTRTGPCTLVPLPGRRSSLVWVTSPGSARRLGEADDDAFASAVRTATHDILGNLSVDGARGAVPLGLLRATRMAAGRIALVGEAAHALPPIGAQGLNLGLADVDAIVTTAVAARDAGEPIGSANALRRYERAREGDVARRAFAVDGLNRALLTPSVPLDAARGFGLGAIGLIGPLRRAAMRAGLVGPDRPAFSARTGSREARPSRGAG